MVLMLAHRSLYDEIVLYRVFSAMMIHLLKLFYFFSKTSELSCINSRKMRVYETQFWYMAMIVKKYIDSLVSDGSYFFSIQDFQKALVIKGSAMWSALSRLKKKKEIVSLARGFYMIVPLEYRNLGFLPPEQFIHVFMSRLKQPYYVGLLSAAKRYGAAHHQPQVFQVLLRKNRLPISIGCLKVVFLKKKSLQQTPTREFITPRGPVIFSSPEATAVDLIAYFYHCGGLDNVLTILGELVDQMDILLFKDFLKGIKKQPILQRLGYLFELLHEEEFANVIEEHLWNRYLKSVPLDTRLPIRESPVNKRWRLIINLDLESDF